MITLSEILDNPFLVLGIAMVVAVSIFFIWYFLQQRHEKLLLQDKKYEINHSCPNCNEDRLCIIPLGTCLNDFLKDKKCGRCGCDLMQEKYKK